MENGEAARSEEAAPPGSLRSRLWRALGSGSNQVLKAKEMRESVAFYDAVRKDVRAKAPQLVVDVCGGHGALGMLFLAQGVGSRATIIDAHRPSSHGTLLDAWRPLLGGADVAYEARPLREALPKVLAAAQERGDSTFVVACHACQHLARDIVDICLAAQVDFAVCPCCPRDAAGGLKCAAATLGVDFGTAMILAEMGRVTGMPNWDARLRSFDAEISPHNRIILGRHAVLPELTLRTSAAEERLQRAYQRAHKRPETVGEGSTRTAGSAPEARGMESYGEQLAAKVRAAGEVLRPLADGQLVDAAFLSPPGLHVRESPAKHFRARTVVSIGQQPAADAGGEGQGLFRFVPGDPWTLCANLSVETLAASIVAALPALAALLSPGAAAAELATGLTCVKLHATVGRRGRQQLLASFVYGRESPVPDAAALGRGREALGSRLASAEVVFLAQARGVQLCVPDGHDYVDEELVVGGRRLVYRQPFGQFSNPNPYMAVHTAEWLSERIRSTGGEPGDLLELYCGAGSHTVALAPLFRQVLAVEINRHLVAAAQHNVAANDLRNVTVVRAPSEEFCRLVIRRRSYTLKGSQGASDTVLNFGWTIVDPPRAGLDSVTVDAVRGYDHVLYVSCNPEALRRDLTALLKSHELLAVVLLDHFPFSAHSELAVHLRLRSV